MRVLLFRASAELFCTAFCEWCSIKLCWVKGVSHCAEQSSLGNLELNSVLCISSAFHCVHEKSLMQGGIGFFILQWVDDRSTVFEKLINNVSEVCWKQAMMNNNNYKHCQHEEEIMGGRCLAWFILSSSRFAHKTEIHLPVEPKRQAVCLKVFSQSNQQKDRGTCGVGFTLPLLNAFRM